MSTYALGDVHGCSRTLQRLLHELPFDAARDRLWLVGDLVAHGPDSLGVLRILREREAELGARFVAVLGNHDLRLLAARAGIDVPRKVRELLDGFVEARDGGGLLDWLAARPLAHHDGAWLLVHAGLLPWWPVAEAMERTREVEAILASPRRRALFRALYEKKSDGENRDSDAIARAVIETARVMTTIRTVRPDGELCDHNDAPESAPPDCRSWFAYPDRRHAEVTVVFGHWAALGLRFGDDWIALDSGCAWGGPLSAVRLEDRCLFQTPRID